MDAASSLEPSNKAYLQALQVYLWDAYLLDMPDSDVTTKAFLGRASQTVQALIFARQDGVLAGIQESEWFLDQLNLVLIESRQDGDLVQKNDTIMTVQGRASDLLAAERTLLNLLQRMSGIATKTKKMLLKLDSSIQLLGTRKTLWGMLDKRAVSVGGGGTHRLNLSDAILVKENHIELAKDFKGSLKSVLKKLDKVRFVEIELESEKQVHEFLEIYEPFLKIVKDQKRVVVMLDNFKASEVSQVLKPLKAMGLTVEVSGGINEANVDQYNLVGIDAISSGSLTMSAPHIDLSMQLNVI